MKKKLHLVLLFIVITLFSKNTYSQGGDNATAAAASPITLPFSAAGTTCGHVDNYNPLSPYGISSGKDWLYYFCAPTNGTVDVFLTNAYGYSSGAMIYSVTPNAGGSNWFATSFTGGNYINSMVSVTVTAGKCYYVMIDNYPTGSDGSATCFNYTASIRYHSTPPSAPLEPACSNIGYDDGTTSSWVGTTGNVTQGALGAPTPDYNPFYYTTSVAQQSITSGAGVDPYGGFPLVSPFGATNSLRLGDIGTYGVTPRGPGGIPGACGATLEQKFTVTPSNALFVYYYAVVIQNALSDSILVDVFGNDSLDILGNPVLATDIFGNNIQVPHKSTQQPFFKTDVIDCTGHEVACGQYLVKGGPNIPGFSLAAGTTDVYYKTWSPVAVDLTPFIGTCVTVRYTVGDCTVGGHFAYAYVDATCNPLAITGVNIVCPKKSTTLTAPVGLFTYKWTPGGATTQSIVVTPTTTTTYTCELTSYTSCKTFLTYSVSLFPSAIVSASSQTVCNGTTAVVTTTVNNAGGGYVWTSGGSTLSTLSVSPSTTTNYTCTYTDLNGCSDTALAKVTVNPIPVMVTPPNVSVCNSATVAASSFTSNVVGTTYNWVNSNTGIGLGANGTSNTNLFTSTNLGNSPILGIITVTPTANLCVGNPINYTVTVNPIPTVNAIPSATYCNANPVSAIAFNGNVTGTSFNWLNSNTSIGLSANGLGNTPSFSASNLSTIQTLGVVSVTPSANSCIGLPKDFTITVNPIPTVNAVPSLTYCNGILATNTTFTGSVTPATYNWDNTNTTIGVAANGTNTVPTFTATNLSSAPIQGVITVTPSANLCIGNPTSFTVIVNPIPNINSIPSATYCNGANVATIPFTGSVTATNFNWVNTNSSIGIAANGMGDISTFNAVNLSSIQTKGVVTVTPTANSCIGIPKDFTITVNPIPTVDAVSSATYCNNEVVANTTFTGSVASTVYNWTNNNTSIGIAANGVANIPGFNATNNGVSQTLGIITVTPTANLCVGTPTDFTITVNPTPTVAVPTNSTYCAGELVPAGTFTGTISNTLFNWTNTNSSIGLSSSGAGNTLPFTSINSGASSQVSVVTVTPSANLCIGNPKSFTITINPVPLAPTVTEATVCPGNAATLTATAPGGTYKWYDSNVGGTLLVTNANYAIPNVTTTTTFYVNTTNSNGCVSPFTPATVTALNVLNVNAIPNQTICIGQTAQLDVTPVVTGNIYVWDAPGNLGFSTINNPTVTPTLTTVYSVTVTSANGCVGNDITQVVVNPLPIATPGNDIAFCDGQSGVIGSTSLNGYSYLWSPNTGLSDNTQSNPTVTIANSSAIATIQNYTLQVTLNGCQASNSVNVTVNPIPVSAAGSNVTLCTTQTGTLGTTTTNGYSYSWAPTTNLNNSTISAPIVTGINPGTQPISLTYTVTTTEIATTCYSQKQVTVSVLPLATINTNIVAAMCEGATSIPISGTIGGSAISSFWSGGQGTYNPNSTNLSTNYIPTATDFSNGSVTLTLTALAQAPCQNKSSNVTINFYKKPVVNFKVDVPKGCPEHCVNFTDLSSVPTPDFVQNWSWDFGDGNTSNIQNPPHCYPLTGLYNVTLTVSTNHNCSSTLGIPQMIEVYPMPIASFNPIPATVGILDPNISFQNTSQGASTYAWNFGDQYAIGSANTSIFVNPNHAYSTTGIYNVFLVATSIHSCVATANANVEVIPEFTFYIPNAFTPGTNDGVNDIFTGMGIGIDKYEMWIFDRWGVNIFYTDDIYKGWNGKVTGGSDEVQQDVYIWKVKLKDVFGKKHDYVGHVTLLK